MAEIGDRKMASGKVLGGLFELVEELGSELFAKGVISWWNNRGGAGGSSSPTSTTASTSQQTAVEKVNLSESATKEAMAAFWGGPGINGKARENFRKVLRELRESGNNQISDQFEKDFGLVLKGLKTGIWNVPATKTTVHSKTPGEKNKDGKSGPPKETTTTTETPAELPKWSSPRVFVNMVNTAGKDDLSVKDFIQSINQENYWDKTGRLLDKFIVDPDKMKEVVKKTKRVAMIAGIVYLALLFFSGILAWYNLSNFVETPGQVVSLVWGTIGFFTSAGLLWFILRNFIPENN